MGSNWTTPMGGCDFAGNPITVSFGTSANNRNETLLGDGDRSGGVDQYGNLASGASHFSFHESGNHDHYGSGNGQNNNGTSRGQYTGPGH